MAIKAINNKPKQVAVLAQTFKLIYWIPNVSDDVMLRNTPTHYKLKIVEHIFETNASAVERVNNNGIDTNKNYIFPFLLSKNKQK